MTHPRPIMPGQRALYLASAKEASSAAQQGSLDIAQAQAIHALIDGAHAQIAARRRQNYPHQPPPERCATDKNGIAKGDGPLPAGGPPFYKLLTAADAHGDHAIAPAHAR